MLRKVGLDEDFTRKTASTSPASNLCKQLEGPLGGSEIGEPELGIRGGYANEGDSLKVVSLGNHLRTDEDVDPALSKCAQNLIEGSLIPRGVAIETRDAGVRE